MLFRAHGKVPKGLDHNVVDYFSIFNDAGDDLADTA